MSSSSEQSKVDSVSAKEVESKSFVMMPLSPASSEIVGEVDLSCLSPAERNHIIDVMKAAEYEESNVLPPVSSMLQVPNTAHSITHDGLFTICRISIEIFS